jgi:hypothetical protein
MADRTVIGDNFGFRRGPDVGVGKDLSHWNVDVWKEAQHSRIDSVGKAKLKCETDVTGIFWRGSGDRVPFLT